MVITRVISSICNGLDIQNPFAAFSSVSVMRKQLGLSPESEEEDSFWKRSRRKKIE